MGGWRTGLVAGVVGTFALIGGLLLSASLTGSASEDPGERTGTTQPVVSDQATSTTVGAAGAAEVTPTTRPGRSAPAPTSTVPPPPEEEPTATTAPPKTTTTTATPATSTTLKATTTTTPADDAAVEAEAGEGKKRP